GGVGLTDEFAIRGPPGQPWRDLVVEIRGPVISDWQRAFERTWRRTGGEDLGIPDPPPCPEVDGAEGRVALSEARERSILANGVVRCIDAAQRRAWIMSAYFVSSRRFRKALRHAARRYYGKMLRNGVNIFEYQPRMLHAKMIVADDWVSIGSSNLDRWSF